MGKIFITKKIFDLNNVSLLLPFDNNFQDFSSNNFAVTANGNVQISSAQSKFGGASALFDGSGDYLMAYTNEEFGTNNWTTEFWFRANSISGEPRMLSRQDAGTGFVYQLRIFNSAPQLLIRRGDGSGYLEVGGITTISTNQWYHIAIVRNGNTISMYIDGTLSDSNTFTGIYSSSLNAPWIIGAFSDSSLNPQLYFDGYIDDLRITKGVARYTVNFIPPGPLFNIGKLNIQRGGVDPFFNNMSLLLPMNTSFADFSSNNFALTVNGNAEIRTDQKKFGDGAGYFGSSSDYLTASSSSLFGFGTGDFTIEMWIYPQGANSFQGLFNANDYTNGILIRWHANSTFDSLYINGTAYDWDPEIYAPVNTWSHVALVRYSGTVKMFVNGVNRIGSVTNNSNIGSSAVPLIGASAHNVGEGFNGYIDDIRVTKGIARYTTDFTPPNVSFPDGSAGKVNISKPVFPMANLLAFWKLNDTSDSSGNSNNLTNNNGVVFGEPGVVGNGARTTWGNSGSYLTTSLSINGDATLSLWFRFDSLPVANPEGFLDRYPLVFQKYPFCALGTNPNYPRKLILTDLATWNTSPSEFEFTVGQWCHIVTVIENSKAKVYANGVLILETPAQYNNTFQSGGRLLGFGGDNVDAATSYGTDTRYDSIGMWTRALTINEVKTLYNNGEGLEP